MNRQSGFNGEKIGGWRLVTGHSLGLFILLIAFTGLGLLYDFTVPLFEKPDELKHFAVIQYIQSHHNLPVVQPGVYKAWDQEGTQQHGFFTNELRNNNEQHDQQNAAPDADL